MWLSLVERCVRDAEVAGSNPVIPTNKKGRLFGVLFCWSAGERILFCRLNTPCPNRTRKTTLTVFFHTIFPSVGDKPAQKSLVSFFVGLLGSVSFIADQTPPALIERAEGAAVVPPPRIPLLAIILPLNVMLWTKKLRFLTTQQEKHNHYTKQRTQSRHHCRFGSFFMFHRSIVC